MRRTFTALLLLTIALAWPMAARAQQGTPAGCTTGLGEALTTEQVQVANPKTGEMEWHFIHIGRVNISCNDIRIVADELDMNSVSSVLKATGNVVFLQGGTRIAAARAEFDLKNKTGVFYIASGTLALQNKPGSSPNDHKMDRSLFGNVEPDAYFHGEKIEKLGPRTYRLTKGGFTTCVQPTPRWEMTESSALITINDHVMLRNMVLRVKDVPVFYVPVLYYPIHGNERATGILMPTYGSSTIRGFTISNAFFWAIGRSNDATFYHDWFSNIGQGYGGEYRFVGDSASAGNARVYFVNTKAQLATDGTVLVPSGTTYNVVGDLSQAITPHLRVQGRANYFSDIALHQLLQQSINDFANRDRSFSLNLNGAWGPMQLSALTELHDLFYGTTQATRYGSAPRVKFNYNQTPLGHSKVYVGFGSEYVSFLRQGIVGDPTTDTGLSRVDVSPSIRAPLVAWSFLSVNTTASWRLTSWSESLNPQGVQVATPVSRQLFVLQATVDGPRFERIFDTPGSGYADKFMHMIEPTFSVRYVTPFNTFSQIVKLDGVDTVVGGATNLSYGLTNHLLARRRQPSGLVSAQEVLNVSVSQTYYTDQNSAAYDQTYQSSEQSRLPSHFSPVVLLASVRPTDRVSGQTRLEYDWQNGAVRSLSAGSSVSLTAVQLNATYTRQFLVPEVPGFNIAASLAHSLGVSTSLRAPNNHLTFAHSWNYDFTHAYLLQQRMTGTYNTQCCGLAFEYQTVYLGNLGPRGIVRDRRFNISFTLAGLGTFSNPLGAFGGTGVK